MNGTEAAEYRERKKMGGHGRIDHDEGRKEAARALEPGSRRI